MFSFSSTDCLRFALSRLTRGVILVHVRLAGALCQIMVISTVCPKVFPRCVFGKTCVAGGLPAGLLFVTASTVASTLSFTVAIVRGRALHVALRVPQYAEDFELYRVLRPSGCMAVVNYYFVCYRL